MYFLRLGAATLLIGALAACQFAGAPSATPLATTVGAPTTSSLALPTATPLASAVSAPATSAPATPPAAPTATVVSTAATPTERIVPDQAIRAALLAQYPGAAIHFQCAEGSFAAAAVAPLGGQHGFDAYLRQQNSAWAIVTNGVDISRESLIKLGFPENFCAMPAARNPTPLPDVPPAASRLVGPEWTLLVSGDLNRNGREDVVAFKPAPITPIEPAPGSQPKDVFVAFRELVVVEQASDGAPAVRLFLDTSTALADNQLIAQMPAADRPTSGVLAELRYLDRSFELRLIDDTGALGPPFLMVRYREDAGIYVAEASRSQPALNIGALTISPSDPAPAGPESGPPGRLVQAGATVTLGVDVQGAREVICFADGLGQSGNRIGSSTDLGTGRAEIVWTVPTGVGQLALYAQARDAGGQIATSPQVPIVINVAGK
jgi:hypothetical protein